MFNVLSLSKHGRGKLPWWRVKGGGLGTSASLCLDGKRIKGSSLLRSGLFPLSLAEQRWKWGQSGDGLTAELGAVQEEQLCLGLHGPTPPHPEWAGRKAPGH